MCNDCSPGLILCGSFLEEKILPTNQPPSSPPLSTFPTSPSSLSNSPPSTPSLLFLLSLSMCLLLFLTENRRTEQHSSVSKLQPPEFPQYNHPIYRISPGTPPVLPPSLTPSLPPSLPLSLSPGIPPVLCTCCVCHSHTHTH